MEREGSGNLGVPGVEERGEIEVGHTMMRGHRLFFL